MLVSDRTIQIKYELVNEALRKVFEDKGLLNKKRLTRKSRYVTTFSSQPFLPIIVCDIAYFSIDTVDHYVTDKEKQHFVIRLKENVQLNRKKSLKGTRTKDSNVTADFTCTLDTPQKQTKKRHHVVQFTDYEGKEMHVVTSLMDVTADDPYHSWVSHACFFVLPYLLNGGFV